MIVVINILFVRKILRKYKYLRKLILVIIVVEFVIVCGVKFVKL